MKIYTGRGDEGMTDLRDDEANALIGTIRPTGHEDVDETLERVQNHLFIVQADFANPSPDEDDPTVDESHVDEVEELIDDADAELDPLDHFILPGGSDPGSKLHHARTVVRRAERRAVELAADNPVNGEAIVYLNRLSDLLFTLARLVNRRESVREDRPTY
ncbi:MAG: cob(I)yrinic acid a,c-diamide adenosyltransferase [Haloplanus sp.]